MKNIIKNGPDHTIWPIPDTQLCLVKKRRPIAYRIIPRLLTCTLFGALCFPLSSCNKEVQEPKHKNNGSNVLYFNIDGKGYLLRDRCLDFPSKKTGDIFGGEERKELPRFVTYEGIFAGLNSLNFTYEFDRTEKGNSGFGSFSIDFTNVNNNIKVISLGTNSRFYSPKQNKQVVFWSKNYTEWPTLEIFNYDKNADHLSGELRFKYFEIDSTKIVDFYLYFDIDVKPVHQIL